MAGNTYQGKNMRIKVGGKTVFHATECSFSTSRNMDSVASKDTNGNIVSPGDYEWSVSTNFLTANKPDASTTQIGTKELLEDYKEGTLVEVEFTTNIVGDVIISGSAYIKDISLNAPTSGLSTGSASFNGSGDFEVETVLV